MKLLVLTSEPVGADALREAVGSSQAQEAEVLVVSPALNRSPLRFWMSDADAEIERAEAVQEETVAQLDAEGIDAAGDTGESEPLLAVQDALATFDADRIVIFAHEDGAAAYRESGFAGEVEERFGLPVEQRLVSA